MNTVTPNADRMIEAFLQQSKLTEAKPSKVADIYIVGPAGVGGTRYAATMKDGTAFVFTSAQESGWSKKGEFKPTGSMKKIGFEALPSKLQDLVVRASSRGPV